MLGRQDQLKALADENRLKVLALLHHENLCVGALAKRLGISKAAVSQHLKVLREAGFVVGEKRGYWVHYQVLNDVLTDVGKGIQSFADNPPKMEGHCDRQRSGTHSCCQEENGHGRAESGHCCQRT